MKYIKTLILLNCIWFLFACGTVKEGFKNKKKDNSDEFLVEKKSPLSMPPDYNELPVPKVSQNQSENEDIKIKSLLSSNENGADEKIENSNDQSKDFEQKLLEKIKQN